MARARVYRLTPARKRALHKAQLASARKRSRNKKIVKGVLASAGVAGVLALTGRTVYKRHKLGRAKLQGPPVTTTSPVVKAALGEQISGAPQQVTQRKPHQAVQNPVDVTFIDINYGLIDHVSKKTHESTAKLHKRLVRFGPEGAKKSPAVRKALERRIGDVSLIEVLERTRHYKAVMAKNGITISKEHERLVSLILGNRRT